MKPKTIEDGSRFVTEEEPEGFRARCFLEQNIFCQRFNLEASCDAFLNDLASFGEPITDVLLEAYKNEIRDACRAKRKVNHPTTQYIRNTLLSLWNIGETMITEFEQKCPGYPKERQKQRQALTRRLEAIAKNLKC